MSKPVHQTVLVVGSGGREHALAWKLAQSPRIAKLYVAPGNGGTAEVAENVAIPVDDTAALLEFAKSHHVDLTVIGPDDPLAAGVVDRFKEAGLPVFGPTQAAAQIEASKAFAKQLMTKCRIPTAAFRTFTDMQTALEYVHQRSLPIVIKASGLALGKGVFICHTLPEAEAALRNIMTEKVFGEAGSEVVIEDYLEGPEVSLHALSDGLHHVLFPTAQDHKPAQDGDQGPNTGGMGTIAPLPWVTSEQLQAAEAKIVTPVLAGLAEDGRAFSGCLYPGLKLTGDGAYVLEFNARFGDPETQSYMRLLKTDLLDLLEACVNGTLDQIKLEWHPGYAACIVAASGGYPEKYRKGLPISGLPEANSQSDIVVFHAGTKRENGATLTAGGRVLGVTATGVTLQEALNKAYAAVALIHFEGMQFRRDIGAKALQQAPNQLSQK